MKLGYDNSFDVLVDAQDDQERQAERERADALRHDPTFLRAVNDDEREFDGSHWASLGKLAQERDRALASIAAQKTRLIASAEAEYRRQLERIALEHQRAIAATHENFESRQDARLNFLAWRPVVRGPNAEQVSA